MSSSIRVKKIAYLLWGTGYFHDLTWNSGTSLFRSGGIGYAQGRFYRTSTEVSSCGYDSIRASHTSKAIKIFVRDNNTWMQGSAFTTAFHGSFPSGRWLGCRYFFEDGRISISVDNVSKYLSLSTIDVRAQ